MSNSRNQISTLSNTAETVKTEMSFRTTPLQWNSLQQ
jgi:hypothetical protein